MFVCEILDKVCDIHHTAQWHGVVHRNPESTDTPVAFDANHSFLLAPCQEQFFQCRVMHGEDSIHLAPVLGRNRQVEHRQGSQRGIQKVGLLLIDFFYGGDASYFFQPPEGEQTNINGKNRRCI